MTIGMYRKDGKQRGGLVTYYFKKTVVEIIWKRSGQGNRNVGQIHALPTTLLPIFKKN